MKGKGKDTKFSKESFVKALRQGQTLTLFQTLTLLKAWVPWSPFNYI
jgi:hypothetical protein